MAVMMDEMGIDTGLNLDKLLQVGNMVERIVGRPLRSESIKSGRIPKSLSGR
jgi:hydroxymethylglutaryl-CoA lyase